MPKNKNYVPERNHIILLDFEPTKGKEIGKYRPALVLSSKTYNIKSELIICCPISTSVSGQITEVPVDNLSIKNSVVKANLIQTYSWRERKAKFVVEAKPGVLEDVLIRLLPLIGANKLLSAN